MHRFHFQAKGRSSSVEILTAFRGLKDAIMDQGMAATFSSYSCCGVCFREYEARHLISLAEGNNVQVPSVFAAEAEALFQGLEFAVDIGFLQWVIAESDSKTLITKLNSKEPDLS
ncbi:hypothetical protein V6N13_043135 [Hibiscus sabdariffa]|uniref:Uncharacterized protein n=2 Tax=Hibiscus sabdariffa TaxID=183260 RepID=A0ABR1ZAQ6_9ROSI